MNSVGLKYQNGELECGFNADSLESFHEAMRQIAAFVETCWPAQAGEAAKVVEEEPAGGMAKARPANWKERQGLA